MIREYFIVYLIHGFAMINMGIFCLAQKDLEESEQPLLRSLKYLGMFGITHGLSEWTTLLTLADIYQNQGLVLYNVVHILKTISFALLFIFGLDLLPSAKNQKKTRKLILLLLTTAVLSGYALLILKNGMNYHKMNNGFTILFVRYGLAFTGGIISSIALFRSSALIEKQESHRIAKGYKQLAWVILSYSVLEGLLVQKSVFFPADIINRELFYEVFGVQILHLKAIVGVIINYLLIKVIETYRWQQNKHLIKLEQDRIALLERSRLGQEIHDSIIQMMYGTGLKVEYLLMNKDKTGIQQGLDEIKEDLNLTIDKTRNLMSSSALDSVNIMELKDSIDKMIKKYNYDDTLMIKLRFEVTTRFRKNISPEKSTEIYYIMQEAVSNIVKHAQATTAEILVEDQGGVLSISIIDDGIGVKETDLLKENHFGILSMQERTKRIRGIFGISRMKKGTCVKIEVPWEDEDDREN